MTARGFTDSSKERGIIQSSETAKESASEKKPRFLQNGFFVVQLLVTMKNLFRRLLTRLFKFDNQISFTYEGVYQNFKHAQNSEENLTDYAVEEWLRNESFKLENLISRLKLNEKIEGNSRDRELLLVIGGMNKEKLEILDIGSGFANTFAYILQNFKKQISYTAIELDQVVEILDKKMKDFKNFTPVTFDSVRTEKFDLVYFGSTLQYIEDYEQYLLRIFKLRTPIIFICDTPMGEVGTFTTIQVNMQNRRIPRWVFSKTELVDVFYRNGYQLVAQSEVDWHQSIHNFMNFPSEYHHISHQNLLFSISPQHSK